MIKLNWGGPQLFVEVPSLPIIDIVLRSHFGDEWYNIEVNYFDDSPIWKDMFSATQGEPQEFKQKCIWARTFHPKFHEDRVYTDWEAFVVATSRYYNKEVPLDYKIDPIDLLHILIELYAWNVFIDSLPISTYLQNNLDTKRITEAFTHTRTATFDGTTLDYICAILKFYNITYRLLSYPDHLYNHLESICTEEDRALADNDMLDHNGSYRAIENKNWHYVLLIYKNLERLIDITKLSGIKENMV